MAQQKIELDLEFTSPYKATRLYVKDGRMFFGLWHPPAITLDGDESEVVVTLGLEGQLDLLAFAVYGDRRLWRVIAQANKIGLPLEEVKVDTVLILPKPQAVSSRAIGVRRETG